VAIHILMRFLIGSAIICFSCCTYGCPGLDQLDVVACCSLSHEYEMETCSIARASSPYMKRWTIVTEIAVQVRWIPLHVAEDEVLTPN